MASSSSKKLKRADPSTIQDKFLVGYQGWFTCGGDGPPVHRGHHGWLHWFDRPIPIGGRPNLDIWPDVSEYSPEELYPAPGLKLEDGSHAMLFSSRNAKTVDRHFHWMAMHGVDGAFLQRFAGQCEVDGNTEGATADIMRIRDEVGDRVREAAEKEGRVFAIMYDVTGVPPERIEKVIQVDWAHLLNEKRILDSPSYLREKGKPVIALWGFGFSDRGHDPAIVRRIVQQIRSVTPGGAYIMAGTPTHWQTSTGDADPNPEFLDVWYNDFDAISPWTVGRYNNEDAADRFAEEKVKKDMEALRNNTNGRHVDYIPVVLPGGSGFNLSQGKWSFNGIPRNGGKFLWRQLYNTRKLGVRIIYGAMWDEYDEGTAFLPVVTSKRLLPKPGKFLALDADGYDLPSDWYMRICGLAVDLLKGRRQLFETFPVKELQDYWSTHPKYEETNSAAEASSSTSAYAGGSGTISGSDESDDAGDTSQLFQEWMDSESQKEEKEDLPPPPYSLEASASERVSDTIDTNAQGSVATSTIAASTATVTPATTLISGAPPSSHLSPMRTNSSPLRDQQRTRVHEHPLPPVPPTESRPVPPLSALSNQSPHLSNHSSLPPSPVSSIHAPVRRTTRPHDQLPPPDRVVLNASPVANASIPNLPSPPRPTPQTEQVAYTRPTGAAPVPPTTPPLMRNSGPQMLENRRSTSSDSSSLHHHHHHHDHHRHSHPHSPTSGQQTHHPNAHPSYNVGEYLPPVTPFPTPVTNVPALTDSFGRQRINDAPLNSTVVGGGVPHSTPMSTHQNLPPRSPVDGTPVRPTPEWNNRPTAGQYRPPARPPPPPQRPPTVPRPSSAASHHSGRYGSSSVPNTPNTVAPSLSHASSHHHSHHSHGPQVVRPTGPPPPAPNPGYVVDPVAGPPLAAWEYENNSGGSSSSSNPYSHMPGPMPNQPPLVGYPPGRPYDYNGPDGNFVQQPIPNPTYDASYGYGYGYVYGPGYPPNAYQATVPQPGYGPPPIPQRPAAPYGAYGGPPPAPPPDPEAPGFTGRISGAANDAYSYTLNTIDRVAGSDARRHLESGIDSITSSTSEPSSTLYPVYVASPFIFPLPASQTDYRVY